MRREFAALFCAVALLLSGCSAFGTEPSSPGTETPQVFTLDIGTETAEPTARPGNGSTATERARQRAAPSDGGTAASDPAPTGRSEVPDA